MRKLLGSPTPPKDGGTGYQGTSLVIGWLGFSVLPLNFLGGETEWSLNQLEKKMAIHSSVVAWRIPWTEELDGLQSMGSHRVGHD